MEAPPGSVTKGRNEERAVALVRYEANGQMQTTSISGAAVLISSDGSVLTAAHVAQAADEIEVEFSDGQVVRRRDWRDGLRSAKALVESYLETGNQAPRLKASQAVGIGFVGGDLGIVYSRSRA